MSAWDIDPAGVNGVISKTKGHADDFEGHLKSISTAMEGGAAGSASEIVAGAINGFVEHITPDVTFVVQRSGAVMNAAVDATNAYIAGDLEMAANAQRSATIAPDAEPPGRGHSR